ncbi:MAG TPA: glutamate synthase large subunit, partial [bacterium]|nr:glutamate synthase large subunit [bacterium]
MNTLPENATHGLYSPTFERDNCGFGLIAQMDDQPSHWLVQTAIESLARMTHRGGISADGKSGDGCGLLLKKPDAFMRAEANRLSFSLNELYAVGIVFMSQDVAQAAQARAVLEREVHAQGLHFVGWRVLPTDPTQLGSQSLQKLPVIEHAFVNAPDGMDARAFDTKLYIARRLTEKQLEQDRVFYIPTLSSQVLSYKGLMMPADLPRFYLDLQDERLASSQCVFHQRFSTNTFPEWRLAQPFRYLAHNGEINTIHANRNWARARAYTLETPLIPNMEDVRPLV